MKWLDALAAELYRLRGATSVRVLLGLPLVAALLRMVFEATLGDASALKAAAEGAGAESIPITGFALLADGLRIAGGVLTFCALVLGALSLVRDRENGMLATCFLVQRRGTLVLAKALAIAVSITFSYFVATLGALALAAFLRGLHGLEIEGVEVIASADLARDVLYGALAALPPMIAAGLFGVAVSAVCSGSGHAMAMTLVPFVTLDVLKSALPGASRYAFSSYAPLLTDGSTLSTLTGIARGYANVDWAPNELWLSCAVPTASGILLVALAVLSTRIRPA